MKSLMRKSWSTVALSMLAATGTVQANGQMFADSSYQPYHDGSFGYQDGSFNYQDSSGCAPSCCSSNFCGNVPSHYGYAYNPPVFIADCCGWTAGLDILYWKFRQDGISYGSEVNLAGVSFFEDALGISGNFEGQQQYVDDKWDVGFRLAVGYKGACDCWDILLSYTHFSPDTVYGRDSTLLSGTTGSIFFPAYSANSDDLSSLFTSLTPFSADGLPTYLGNAYNYGDFEAEADLKLRFDQLDLDASRQFYVGRCVTLKPVVGLRALWIDEKYNILYTGTNFPGVATGGGSNATAIVDALKFDNEFRGLGLKAGLDSTFALGCGLSVYGSVTGSLVYGTFKVKEHEQFTFSGSYNGGDGGYSFQNNDRYNDLLVGTDLGVGFSWTQLYNNDRNAFSLRVGYEQHIFFDYNRFRQLNLMGSNDLDNSPGGNLNLYGIVFGAHLGF